MRLNTIIQTGTLNGLPAHHNFLRQPSPTSPSRQQHQQQRERKELSLAVVLERARARLEDARGGGEVAVREGVVSQRPYVIAHPQDREVDEGGTAEFSVRAGVSGVG